MKRNGVMAGASPSCAESTGATGAGQPHFGLDLQQARGEEHHDDHTLGAEWAVHAAEAVRLKEWPRTKVKDS
jgi:hypothetical protein